MTTAPKSTPLPVRFTPEQRSVLEEIAAAAGKTMSEIVIMGVATIAKTKGKTWPSAPTDRRRRATPKPKPPEVRVPRLPAHEYLDLFLRKVNEFKGLEKLEMIDWCKLAAVYDALRAATPALVSDSWTEMDRHRVRLTRGDKQIPGVDPKAIRILRALLQYEAIRNEWAPQWRSLYGGVDRTKMPPKRLQKLRAGDAKRQRKSRATKAALKAAERATSKTMFEGEHVELHEPDNDSDSDATLEAANRALYEAEHVELHDPDNDNNVAVEPAPERFPPAPTAPTSLEGGGGCSVTTIGMTKKKGEAGRSDLAFISKAVRAKVMRTVLDNGLRLDVQIPKPGVEPIRYWEDQASEG